VGIDERRFRDALGHFPTGVAVISTVSQSGEWLGMTVSSFNSISLTPPLVMFCIAKRAISFAAWSTITRFAVSILEEGQEELSNRFARSKGEKWKGLNPVLTASGIPMVPNSLVAFECETYSRYDGGDHEMILGHVLQLHWGFAASHQPLVVAKGHYYRVASCGTSMEPSDAMLLYGW
jgi:flavin reductase (DIM6/NTAB) family NADH-FMN oxidoreductase RutF